MKVNWEAIGIVIVLLSAMLSGTWYLSHKLTSIELSTGVLVVRVDKLENDFERIIYRDLAGTEHSVIRSVPKQLSDASEAATRVQLRSL